LEFVNLNTLKKLFTDALFPFWRILAQVYNFSNVSGYTNCNIYLHIRIQHKMANPVVFLFYFLDHFRIELFPPLPKKGVVFGPLTRGLGVKAHNHFNMKCEILFPPLTGDLFSRLPNHFRQDGHEERKRAS
jgi:hypothetical protein